MSFSLKYANRVKVPRHHLWKPQTGVAETRVPEMFNKTVGDEVLYDEAWMRRQNYSSVSKRAMYVEKSGIRGLRSSEAGWWNAWKSEVKDYGIRSKVGQKTTAFSTGTSRGKQSQKGTV